MDFDGLDMSTTLGPVYWGTVISLVLGGITVLQAYTYFPHPSDRPFIQVTAASMVIFDFVSSALVVQSVYYYLVPHFGSLAPLASITPELSAECLLSSIITFISQFYFVAQIYAGKTGRGSWMVPVFVAVCAILALVFGVELACTSVMFVFHHNVLGDRHRHFELFFGLAKGFGALTDIVATVAMCKLLSNAGTGMSSYVLTAAHLLPLTKANLAWMAFHVNVTKLYANTFFAMLNSREQLKDRIGVSTTSFTNLSQGRLPTKQTAMSAKQIDAESQDRDYDGGAYHMHSMPTVTQTVMISNL
ncbi:hypothetical protein PLEOSDRAFT_163680 [Pleurotus ostreatus PC15]|uniref:Uncharacterized protein n=1 Tax=Pleurotus ostreatus (strain PC15) TaxID=1137138 RepID=A0A067N760_PLEO1|nr:hypothetical protein PLEOSDRAFT_163680 [Pleurotus ostreatus PC15]